MNSSALANESDIRVPDVAVSEAELTVAVSEGRTIIVPLACYPRLMAATPEQRARWEVPGANRGIHQPDPAEDLSTEGRRAGARAPRGSPLRRPSLADHSPA